MKNRYEDPTQRLYSHNWSEEYKENYEKIFGKKETWLERRAREQAEEMQEKKKHMAMLKQEQKESAPASSAILEDYVLVPVEPTGERLTRGLMALLQCSMSELDNYSLKLFSGYEDDVRRVYLAMTKVTK